jgi:hypothetical protein
MFIVSLIDRMTVVKYAISAGQDQPLTEQRIVNLLAFVFFNSFVIA